MPLRPSPRYRAPSVYLADMSLLLLGPAVRDEGARRFPGARLFSGDGPKEGLRTESRRDAQGGGGVDVGVGRRPRQRHRQGGLVDLPYPPE